MVSPTHVLSIEDFFPLQITTAREGWIQEKHSSLGLPLDEERVEKFRDGFNKLGICTAKVLIPSAVVGKM